VTEEELEALVLEAIRHATEKSVEEFPEGSAHKRVLEERRIGFVAGHMRAWLDRMREPQEWEYGFAGMVDPITYVHDPSPTREAIEYLWGPECRNELHLGRVVRRRMAGPWEEA
jgi:hypothetical protein